MHVGPRRHAALAALLALALGLRIVLVARGGQGFWPDERRYGAALEAVDALGEGRCSEALLAVFRTPHLGFKLLMVGPALLQRTAGVGLALPALFLSLVSVANIAWVWRIARRAGADEREALWAAAAMACSSSMFYWSRHLMPYDLSLFCALASLHVGWKVEPRALDSWLVGFLGFLAFATYNGYWTLVVCVLGVHALLAWPSWRGAAERAARGLAGLAGGFSCLMAVAYSLNVDLLRSYADFSGTITRGDFEDGYRVFFEYLWHAERLTAIVWAAALPAFGVLARGCGGRTLRRGLVWVAMILAIAGALIASSNLLETFVVYGRLVRQVVPFCALLVGWTAARLLGQAEGWRWREATALLTLVACGAVGCWPPLCQEFPREFHRRAAAYRETLGARRVAGIPVFETPDKFLLLNARFRPVVRRTPLPPHEVLLQSPHPFEWRPYLYEGSTRRQRDRYTTADIHMKLVRLLE
jgi:hypothetical protein